MQRKARKSVVGLKLNLRSLRSQFRWADGLLLFAMALTVLEGAIRKWVVGSESGTASYLVYFSKDIAFAAMCFCPVRRPPSAALNVFSRWLAVGCGFLLCGAVVSASIRGVNPVGALLTMRATLVLPIIAWLAVRRLAPRTLLAAVWLLALLTIGNCILSVAQNSLPAESLLNRYVVADAAIVHLDAGVRATGTFAYITGLGVLSSIGVWAGLALLSLATASRQRIAAWLSLVAGFGCGLAAVSRATVVMGVAMIGCWIIFSRSSLTALTRSLSGAGLACLFMLLFGAIPVAERLISGLQERMEDVDDTFDTRVFGQLDEVITAFQIAPFGNGLGSEQVGGNYYRSGELTFTNFEYQLPRLMLETGVFGELGFFMTCIGAVAALQNARRNANTYRGRAVAFATQLLLAPLFYVNVVFNHTACSFCWLIFAAALAAIQVRATKLSPRRVEKN